MQIFIMRHGEAANIAGPDSLRPLTKKGLLEAEKMGLWLGHSKPKLINVFVSPYLRAQQTCAKVINALSAAGLFEDANVKNLIPETLDFITPSGNARQVHDFIDGLFSAVDVITKDNGTPDTQAILLVSHMPFISYLVAELTRSINTPIFSTGSIAIIDYNVKQMQGQLIRLVSPSNMPN